MGPQVVGQRDALAAGPLVDEEAGLGELAAAADVEGVDDVGEAEPDRGLGELRGLQFAAVAGPAGSRNWLWADVLCRSSTCRCSQRAAA